MGKAKSLSEFLEDLILQKFHGFTRKQWREELSKQFPYNEIECLVEMAFVEGYDIGLEKGKDLTNQTALHGMQQ